MSRFALDLLPEAHALALRLIDDGADTAVIASQLEIEYEAVPLLLRVAEDKLATLLGQFPARDPTATEVPPTSSPRRVAARERD